MIFRRIFSIAVLFCLISMPCAFTAETTETTGAADTLVAKVDGVEIAEPQLLERVDMMVKRYSSQIDPSMRPKLKASLYQQALDSLIAGILLENAALKNKITVPDKEVEERLKTIKAGAPSEEEFKKLLAAGGLTEKTLKESIKKELVLSKVIETQVKEPADPTNQEIDEQYKKYYTDYKDKLPPEDTDMIRASHILLKFNAETSDEGKVKIKTEMESILKKIQTEKIEFAEAAKQYSNCPSSSKGGDLSYFPRGNMVKPFEDAAFALKEDELSGIVETRFGYHIIKKTGDKKAKEVIREQVTNFILQKTKDDARKNYIAQLKDAAKIEILMTSDAWKAKYEPKPGQVQIDPSLLQLK